MDVTLIAVLIALVIAYQFYISRRVVIAQEYTDQQRRWQMVAIWTLPVIGACLCHLMLREITDLSWDAGASDNGGSPLDHGSSGTDGNGGAGD